MAYISWLGKRDTSDSILTALLRKAGAVFLVKTSVPQTLMVCETVNNIIGRTSNPRNLNLSCGGSSGGEGAMIAMRGGAIGIGTDIGRYPYLVHQLLWRLMISRWIYSCPSRIQLLVWDSSKSRSSALRWYDEQHGRSGNDTQRRWTNCAFCSR